MTDGAKVEGAAAMVWRSGVPMWVYGTEARYYLTCDDKNVEDAGVLVEVFPWTSAVAYSADHYPTDPEDSYTLNMEDA